MHVKQCKHPRWTKQSMITDYTLQNNRKKKILKALQGLDLS